MAAKRVLITGADGFIGRHVVAAGLRREYEIHTLTIAPHHQLHTANHVANIMNPEAVAGIIAAVQPEACIHLAATGIIGPDAQIEAINVDGTRFLLKALAKHSPAAQLVVAGSGYEYVPQQRPIGEEDPIDGLGDYGRSKVAAFRLAEKYADRLAITWLRLFNIYGCGEPEKRLIPSIIAAARRDEPVELTDCEQVRDFVHVSDIAEAFWTAIERPMSGKGLRVFNVGSGEPMRLREFVEEFAAALADEGHAVQLKFGAKSRKADEPEVYAADTSKIRRELGWVPKTSRGEGIRMMLERTLATAR